MNKDFNSIYMKDLEQTNSQLQKVEQRLVIRGWKKEEKSSYCLMSTEFLLGDEKVLGMDSDNSYTTLNLFNVMELYIYEWSK